MTKCLIIGSGIVGLTTAYELNKTGHQVTIIDNQSTGQASKSAAGIMFPLNPWKNTKYMQDLCISGHEQYNNFFNTLSIEDKREINFEKKNLLIFGNDIESAKNWYDEKPAINSSYIKGNLNSREKFIKGSHKDFLEIKNINIHSAKPTITEEVAKEILTHTKAKINGISLKTLKKIKS